MLEGLAKGEKMTGASLFSGIAAPEVAVPVIEWIGRRTVEADKNRSSR